MFINTIRPTYCIMTNDCSRSVSRCQSTLKDAYAWDKYSIERRYTSTSARPYSSDSSRNTIVQCAIVFFADG